MTGSPAGPFLVAVSVFTVVPVPDSTPRGLDRAAAARAVRWLPVVGALLGSVAALVLALASVAAPGPGGRLLGALLAVTALALLTGGLHLDGLADTVDGLASRRPAAEALRVMDRSDVGPLGAAALVLTLGLQATALAATARPGLAAGALVVAACTGRAAVLVATGPGVPSARPGGFGALVTGSTPVGVQRAVVGSLLCLVVAVATVLAGPGTGVRLGAACALGLLLADQVRRGVQRRLGGLTGDVFGALVEITTTVVLVAVALTG
jgi:adenosylcobinamide-GDP ribazoletransferase